MRRWPGLVFAVYAAFHFTMTHIPNLQVRGPIPRTDLLVHLGAFGTWTVLLCFARFFGAVTSTRNLGICWLLGLANALLDEALQGIPMVHRHCAWDDATANMTGATTAIMVMVVYALVRLRRSEARAA